MTSRMSDFGAYMKPVKGFNPVAQAAGAVNGPAIDRQGYESMRVHGSSGASTGTPTSFTADFKVQHSDDGSTGWADYAPGGAGATSAAVGTLTTINSEVSKNFVLAGAKRYIRVVCTLAFVGGTTPTLVVGSVVALGGSRAVPAV
jgi:hypothetical protein